MPGKDLHLPDRVHSQAHWRPGFAPAGSVAILYSPPGTPAAVVDLAREVVAHHHPRAAGLVVTEMNEAGIAILLGEIGPVLGEDVDADSHS